MIVLAAAVATTIVLAAKKPAWIVLVLAGLATAAIRTDTPDLFGYEALNWANTTIAWLIVAAGLAGWALRNRSWRVGVVTVVFAAAVFLVDEAFVLALVLLAAAAGAAGPRRSPLYVGGVVAAACALVPIVSVLGTPHGHGWIWLVAVVAGLVAAAVGFAKKDWGTVALGGIAAIIAGLPFETPWLPLAAAAVMIVGGVFR